MENNSLINPSICIDLKKKRIRIHKVTLHQMRNPSYIQILVNPTTQGMIIRKCSSKDKYAHKVKEHHMNGDYCYELYSKELLMNMKSVADEWEDEQSYRIYGSYNSTLDAAFFSLKDIITI